MTSFCINKEQSGLEILIRGTVQGVGFRPFVYNLASRLGIAGTVTNTSDGVLIRAYAQDDGLVLFLEGLKTEAPVLARITSIDHHPLAGLFDGEGFTILASVAGSSAKTAIPPDIALCDDCLRELRDPSDHRYNYPFINCTNCGPRFTIVETIPYDRPKTSMKVFPMCEVCASQYADPRDRRFHAQPNACGECGPQLSWHNGAETQVDTVSPLAEAAQALANDKVVAMRGLGGFHLSVNGHSASAITLLRNRKGRPDKPLAVMMPDVASIRKYCRVSEQEEELLLSTMHPIVLLQKNEPFALPEALAPHVSELGVMLPYTPFQHLLFQAHDCPDVLVMTSGNVSGAPICTTNDDALKRLAHIADAFLLHNREIVTRVDDSVVRIVADKPQIYRRARGYVPSPVEIVWKLPEVIGCGAGLKSTFSLGRENSVYPSQHIGDLFNLESYDFYTESIEHLKKVFQIDPEIAVCDLHPDYMSSRYAAELGLPLYRVQHHHAHAAAVMAEHGLTDPVLAVVLDGTGFGDDGTIWGGEVLLAQLTDFQRLAHLEHLQLPGGDAAATEPWRMGLAALYLANGRAPWPDNTLPPGILAIPQEKRAVINTMLANGFNTPLTSSCGRLFDAIASLLSIRQHISYEGQAAIELEALAKQAATSTWFNDIPAFSELKTPTLLCEKGGKMEICSTEFVRLALAAQAGGNSAGQAALLFHFQLIATIAELVARLARMTGIRQVVLAGGSMQNSLLQEGLLRTLKTKDLQIFTGMALPVNDGAISFGQTIIGGLQHVSRNTHAGGKG
ncbi:carbamoyltransferase HypF [Desulfopila aestuarii]|uniref:Carbamoyltransferase n=1 Tax=Desulfopila aestuarii DSM 18488 TaxID=1121416 RepID=A0A1M7Y6D5_9BACT|nr:carbamoyltransferase HypF [Desulfopila aestuarii]SHO48217.1 Hydrogenase maturation protein, carbamoyltransferase HypF [Desulfopila aestuarii DSM 18488]